MYKRLRHPVLDRSTSDVYYKIKEQLRDQLRCNSNAVTRSSSLMQLRAALAMRLLSAQARALLAAATYAGTYLYLWKLKVRVIFATTSQLYINEAFQYVQSITAVKGTLLFQRQQCGRVGRAGAAAAAVHWL